MGMCPTAGWGCGVDRLCMLFTGAQTIKEVIAFPMFRSSVLKKGKK
jgi:lysyl-tRNA synthetase class 2